MCKGSCQPIGLTEGLFCQAYGLLKASRLADSIDSAVSADRKLKIDGKPALNCGKLFVFAALALLSPVPGPQPDNGTDYPAAGSGGPVWALSAERSAGGGLGRS